MALQEGWEQVNTFKVFSIRQEHGRKEGKMNTNMETKAFGERISHSVTLLLIGVIM
jgi:hypothetical protein